MPPAEELPAGRVSRFKAARSTKAPSQQPPVDDAFFTGLGEGTQETGHLLAGQQPAAAQQQPAAAPIYRTGQQAPRLGGAKIEAPRLGGAKIEAPRPGRKVSCHTTGPLTLTLTLTLT